MSSGGTKTAMKELLKKLCSDEDVPNKNLSGGNERSGNDRKIKLPTKGDQKSRTMRPERSASVTAPGRDISERKILNVGMGPDAFLSVCGAFENFLDELDSVDNVLVLKKLINIRNLIDSKISFDCDSSECQSVLSVSSSGSIPFSTEPGYQRFLKTVICPFCLETQNDKLCLAKHITVGCSETQLTETPENKNFPFAEFQILPNNTFKCNVCKNWHKSSLQSLYSHKWSKVHVQTLKQATKSKSYAECLFCSCCKVLVNNNYTEIKFHINHQIHLYKRKNSKNTKHYLDQGILCVFNESKKLKCLICPSANLKFHSLKKVLEHFNNPSHLKHRKDKFPFIFCEVCQSEISNVDLHHHFNSLSHKENESSKADKGFQLCLFCGFVCDNLKALLNHMKCACVEVLAIGEESVRCVLRSKVKNLETKGSKMTTQRKGPHIIITDCSTSLKELYEFFEEFGEIAAIDLISGRDRVIEFREESAVEEILSLGDVLMLNGVKLKIINAQPNKGNKNALETKSSNTSADVSDSSDDADPPVLKILDELFDKVSIHLKNSTNKFNVTQQQKIIEDCRKDLGVECCEAVGFSACDLSFPFESFNLFCSFPKSSLNNLPKAFETSYVKLSESELWTALEMGYEEGHFSHIKCIHQETQKPCTINFRKSSMLLTSILKGCLQNNEIVQHFCLIIRFWFSVHDLKLKDCEYALISLLAFFLINRGFATPPSDCLDQVSEPEDLCDFLIRSGTQMLQVTTINELFQEFLYFLSRFDFKKWAIYLPVRYPVDKTFFSAKFKHFTNTQNAMCIVDPISFTNLAENIKLKDREDLLDIVHSTIQHYKIK